MKPPKSARITRKKISDVWVDVIQNTASEPAHTVIYMHGGGFVYGTNTPHKRMLSVLSKYSNATIYAVDYSTAPEHTYPTALNELISVYTELSRKHKNIVVAGDSSGGNLVLNLCIHLRDTKKLQPHKMLLLCPATDATATNKWMSDTTAHDLLSL